MMWSGPRATLLTALVVSLAVSLAVPARAGFIDHFATDADIGPDKVPHLGVSHILVVPVVVLEDGLPDEAALLAGAQDFYGDQGAGFTFANYFRVASLGRFDPVLTIAPTVTFDECPFSRNSDGNCSIARGDLGELVPAVRTVKQILDQVDASIDFMDFDVNGATPGEPDGHVDGVLILSNIDFGGIALPHWRICQNAIASIACLLAGIASWDSTYDGVLVPFTAIAAARYGDVERALNVSVHEFGHLLGFADLYDESDQSTDLPYSVMGEWRYDEWPQLPDAFSRYVIGWGNPRQASADGVVRLYPAHSHGDLLKLGTGQEYFLVENRRPASPWDGDMQPGGVAVLHVNLAERPDADEQSFVTTINSCVQCTTWSPMLMLEQADGLFELQAGPDNRDDLGDLFRTGDLFPSGPDGAALSALNHELNSNLYSGASTGTSLTVLDSELPGEVAELSIAQPALADPCADLLCPAGAICVDGVCSGLSAPDAGPMTDAGLIGDASAQRDAGVLDAPASDLAMPDLSGGWDTAAADHVTSPDDATVADDAVTSSDAGETRIDAATGAGAEAVTDAGCGCAGTPRGSLSPFAALALLWLGARRRSVRAR